MKDVRIQMLMLCSQNAENQAGAQVDILVLIFMYRLKLLKTNTLWSAVRFSTGPCKQRHISHLYLVISFYELLKAHLLLQVEAKLFQATEDAVMVHSLDALVLSTAICGETQWIRYTENDMNRATVRMLWWNKGTVYDVQPQLTNYVLVYFIKVIFVVKLL